MRSLRLFLLYCAALAGQIPIPVREEDADHYLLSNGALRIAQAAEHRWELYRTGARP